MMLLVLPRLSERVIEPVWLAVGVIEPVGLALADDVDETEDDTDAMELGLAVGVIEPVWLSLMDTVGLEVGDVDAVEVELTVGVRESVLVALADMVVVAVGVLLSALSTWNSTRYCPPRHQSSEFHMSPTAPDTPHSPGNPTPGSS